MKRLRLTPEQKEIDMALIIEESYLKAAHITADELRMEIAILLYQMGKLSMGKASKFVGLNRIIFQKELAKRKIPVSYDIEELNRDIETLGREKDDRSK